MRNRRGDANKGAGVVGLASSRCGETDDVEAEYSSTEEECEQTLGATG